MEKKKLRFFAYRTAEGLWVAHCVDLSLAAQADTFEEVKAKLHEQVVDFCDYVNSQQHDPVFQRQLLGRRAALLTRIHYGLAVLAGKLRIGVHRGAPARPRRWSESRSAIPC